MNDYRKILEEKAKIGLEELKQFIEQDNNLLYETEEEENFITINIFMFDENSCTEFLESYEFEKNKKV